MKDKACHPSLQETLKPWFFFWHDIPFLEQKRLLQSQPIPSGAGLGGSAASGSGLRLITHLFLGREGMLQSHPFPSISGADAWRPQQLHLRVHPVGVTLAGLAVPFSSWSGLPDPRDHTSDSPTVALYTVWAFDWPRLLVAQSQCPELHRGAWAPPPSLRDARDLLSSSFCQHLQRGPAQWSL